MTVTTGSRTEPALFADRYRVSSVLGHGGCADVLRAVDERLDREVALKVVRPGATADTARRFRTEARVLARLHHPGLVEVYDYGIVAQRPYLALELVDGPTLAATVRSAPLPTAEVRRLGRDLAQTLAFVHTHGVVHRDVKPSNVLLDRDGRPRLADFGVARLLHGPVAPGDEELTHTGLVVGTPAYLAPEQMRGQGARAAADVYALGLLLLECLTGNREYTGAPIEAAAARLHRPPAIPRHLPGNLATTLLRMTSMDPEQRPSAAACAELLEVPEPEARSTLALPHPSRRTYAVAGRPALLAAVSVLVLAGVGGSTAFDDRLPAAPRPAAVLPSAPAASEPVPAQPSPSSPPATEPAAGAVARPAAPPAPTGVARSAADRPDDGKQKGHRSAQGKKRK
ncbi:hypothetical protein KCMC57_up61790 [Kitasatospora sp. CMC57]|uniref:non-specific serine/threonine protein kinase n=1 Tax=Kitasatospora sp. CMC57 TaxID=3231513 RepID=A0AB33K2L4_9ACTN